MTDSRIERIDTHRFVSEPPTEFLASATRRLTAALAARLAPGAELLIDTLLDLGRAELQPDLTVRSADDSLPLLVVEVRRESTDRYALGLKRMAYGRAGIPEYWFADPVFGRLLVMRLGAGEPDYPWPPLELRHGEAVPEGGVGGGLAVDEALPPLVDRYQPMATG